MHLFRHLPAQRGLATLLCATAVLPKLLVLNGYMDGLMNFRLPQAPIRS